MAIAINILCVIGIILVIVYEVKASKKRQAALKAPKVTVLGATSPTTDKPPNQ